MYLGTGADVKKYDLGNTFAEKMDKNWRTQIVNMFAEKFSNGGN
jgi:hypothetical protein